MCLLNTSGVAERFEVEGKLLHTLSGLLIMLRVFWAGYQGDRLSLRNLEKNHLLFASNMLNIKILISVYEK